MDKLYSWTHALLNDFLPRFGVETTFMDGRAVNNFKIPDLEDKKETVTVSITSGKEPRPDSISLFKKRVLI